MSSHIRSRIRVIGTGLTAASGMVALMFLGRLWLGVPLVPELLAEILFAKVPLAVFAYLLFLMLWGWETLRWVEVRRPPHPWLASWLLAVLLWTLTVGGLFDRLTGSLDDRGVVFSLGTLLLLHSIYGFGLMLGARSGVINRRVNVVRVKAAILKGT